MNQSFLAHYALILIQHLGYGGLALALILNSMGIPLPSEVLLPVSGLGVRDGTFNAVAVVVLAIIAQLIGATASHWIGRRGGVPLVQRYGRYVLLSEKDLELAHRWFERYGRVTAVFGYCLPLLRGYVGYAAGIAQMSRASFIASASLGITIWTLAMVYAGYRLADNLAAIERVMRPFSYLIAALVVAGLAFAIWHRLREQRA